MRFRALGKTGLSVSEIGLGATQIGDPNLPDSQADRVLNEALDLGINFIDTAARYFRSEERIGKFLSKRKDQFIVSTKCGAYREEENGAFVARSDYSRKGILDSIDRSRKRMRLDVIDIVLFHGPPSARFDAQEAYEALLEARSLGWTRFVGLSAEGPAAVEAARTWPLDVHEFGYNILYQEAEADLLPALRELQRGGIANRPVANSVFLQNTLDQGSAANLMRERARHFPLAELADDMPLFEFVLRFTLSHPVVSTAIIGTTSPEHLRSNARISDGRLLPDETVQRARSAFLKLNS